MRLKEDTASVRVTLRDFKGSNVVGKSLTFSIYETTKENVEQLIKEAIRGHKNKTT